MKVTQANLHTVIKSIKEKNNINVILLYGNEEALILDFLHTLKVSLSEYILQNIDSEGTTYLYDLNNEINTQSIFGDKKILFLHNFNKKDGKKISEILSNIEPSIQHITVISYIGSLEATNTVRKICEATPHFVATGIYAETQAFIEKTAKTILDELKMQYVPTIPQLLSTMFLSNSTVMKQEIHKLYLYLLPDLPKVTEDIVYKVLQQDSHENIFDLPIFICEKNTNKALTILENAQSSDVNPIVVFTGISLYIKKLYFVKKALTQKNPESIEILLKKNAIFFQQESFFKKHLSKYTLTQIVSIIEKLNLLEAQTRNTVPMAYNCIKNFVVNVCM